MTTNRNRPQVRKATKRELRALGYVTAAQDKHDSLPTRLQRELASLRDNSDKQAQK